MKEHVLVIMPHPDDETFAVGGTIALYAQRGVPVTYVCGTRGEMGRRMGRPPFATRESLPGLREKELREACRILGITDLRFLGLWDKTVEFEDPEALAARLKAIIEEIQPSLIITYHPDYSVHPDHMALGRATVRAVAQLPPDRRPPVHTRAFGKASAVLGEPDLVVDVRPVWETKLAAIRAHRSQSALVLAEDDPEAQERLRKDREKETFYVWKFEE
ncbi:bacillithiol biosynthesis deacetylase BshB2 [Symbiobacterium thermophilum]|uniref:Bacillithiol biosynthesis deacetylase BshB2 n=1 Tax=Symbiobacterium thermophilum TaxID=2734 RepID=A0A953I4E9_SYMTR|nr:bacillithiol biosynthesis deacetylase BshB2 [Symbiobacterium thermophilum]MBY6277395.1 bacillithiol biosynthesis deacetylase BshB2 [Symbiobacterium thermophilum]